MTSKKLNTSFVMIRTLKRHEPPAAGRVSHPILKEANISDNLFTPASLLAPSQGMGQSAAGENAASDAALQLFAPRHPHDLFAEAFDPVGIVFNRALYFHHKPLR
jgi:hypothetical protein